jgi:hypothetical protein
VHAHDAQVIVIMGSAHESSAFCPVNELDSAVMPQQEVVSDVADARRPAVASHRKQKLVLRGGQPRRACCLLAPPKEPPQAVSELEQLLEVGVGEPLTG